MAQFNMNSEEKKRVRDTIRTIYDANHEVKSLGYTRRQVYRIMNAFDELA